MNKHPLLREEEETQLLKTVVGKTFDVNQDLYFDGDKWYSHNPQDRLDERIPKYSTLSFLPPTPSGTELSVEMNYEENDEVNNAYFDMDLYNIFNLIKTKSITLV
jgi:hypothetical protein